MTTSSVERDGKPARPAAPPSPAPHRALDARIAANQIAQKAVELVSRRDSGSSPQTIDLFEEALRTDAGNELALENYSNYLVVNHELDSALPLLKRCVEAHPKNALCNGNLTNYYAFKNEPEALDQATRGCLTTDPENMLCLNNRGNFLLRQEKFSAAIEIFRQMEESNSRGPVSFGKDLIYWNLGLSYAGLPDAAKAREYFALSCREGNEPACARAR